MNKTVSKKYKIKSNSLYIKQVILNLLSQHLFYRVQNYTIFFNNTKKTSISGKKNRNHMVAIPVMLHRLASRQVKLLSC